jgi:hypothetical protein
MVITKLSGVINVDAVTRFTESSFGTRAHCGTATFILSEKPILTTIVEAIRNKQDFLEVE